VRDGRAYWVSTNQVLSTTLSGGGAGVLVWKSEGEVQALAASPSWAEIYAFASGTLVRIRDGEDAMTIATGLLADRIVADDSFVYLAHGSPGYIMKVPISGGAPRMLAKGGRPAALAIDQHDIYWLDADSKAVLKLGKGT
jgi:hypothetical protein